MNFPVVAARVAAFPIAAALVAALPVAAVAQSLVPLESAVASQSGTDTVQDPVQDMAPAPAAGTALPEDEAGTEDITEEAELSVIERWQADPTQIFDAAEVDLNELVWVARPVVVFANSATDPQFQQQIALLQARVGALVERDVILITDTDPAAQTSVRQELRPRGFMLVLISKDGNVGARRPAPWDVRELTRSIDKMPDRQQEIRDRRSAP